MSLTLIANNEDGGSLNFGDIAMAMEGRAMQTASGEDAEIVESDIGAYVSIQKSSRIMGARIEDSVVLEDSTLHKPEAEIRQCIVAHGPDPHAARPD